MTGAGDPSFGYARAERTVSPEERAWLDGFERTAGSEGDARQAWGHVVEVARRVPSLGALLGGAMASVVLEAVGVPTVLVHVHGGEGDVRRRTLRAAVAASGDPSALVRPWGRAPMAVVRRLRLAGVLPVAFEGSSVDPSAAVVRSVLAGGVVAPGGRAADRARPWTLSVLSTGGDPVGMPPSLAGSVFQPFAPSAPEVDSAHEAAVRHHGWPLFWLARSELLGDVVRDHGRAVEVLEEGRWETVGAVSAVAVALSALGRLVGRERSLEADVTSLGRALLRSGG